MTRERTWRVVDADEYSLRIFDQDDEEIAVMVSDEEDRHSTRTRAQRDEDAALIVAAPALLAALECIAGNAELHPEEARMRARDAIKLVK